VLSERHARHRRAEPLLPSAYEDPADARREIEALRKKDRAVGVVAARAGTVAGYLTGAPGDDDVWGPNIWIELAGHAVDDAELVRDLYAAVATGWVEAGRTRHYAVVPATDAALVDSWFRLGFGQQQAYGISEIAPTEWPEAARKAEPRDVDAMVDLAPKLPEHQLLSPVFSGRGLDMTREEIRADIDEDFRGDRVGSFVAERNGRLVGNFVVCPSELSSMHRGLAQPERSCYLAFAIVTPEARGTGAGLALTQACFAWAYEAGYETMVTDWRVTNLLASRFWPARGFRTSFLRLYRSIP